MTEPWNRSLTTVVGGLDSDDITTEDNGRSRIAEISSGDRLFIRIQSWDDDKEHPEFEELIKPGARYRVTIERWDAGVG